MYPCPLLLFALVSQASASPHADSVVLTLECNTAAVGGTVLLPRANRPFPFLVLAGGTLSKLRDVALDRQGVPQRTALKRLAESLAAAGYGSFRYDQFGHGSSRPKPGCRDSRLDREILKWLEQGARSRGHNHDEHPAESVHAGAYSPAAQTSQTGPEAFVRCLQGLAANLFKEQEAGTVFWARRSAPSHPALDFAREANPRFDCQFPLRRT